MLCGTAGAVYHMLGTVTCFEGTAGAVYHMLGTAMCFVGTAGAVYHMLGTATCFVGIAGAVYHMLGTVTCFVGIAGAVYHMLGTATCFVGTADVVYHMLGTATCFICMSELRMLFILLLHVVPALLSPAMNLLNLMYSVRGTICMHLFEAMPPYAVHYHKWITSTLVYRVSPPLLLTLHAARPPPSYWYGINLGEIGCSKTA